MVLILVLRLPTPPIKQYYLFDDRKGHFLIYNDCLQMKGTKGRSCCFAHAEGRIQGIPGEFNNCFQLEKSQRRTFDVSYNLVVQLENLVRSRKEKIRIFFIGNTTEEASDILSMFNFIPQEFGVYKLKSKRCVIDYMPNSEAYNARRKGSVGDILAGNTSNFTNNIETDTTLVNKERLKKPMYIIKFSKDKSDWFTVWDNNTIAKWNKENKSGLAMRRYVDEQFSPEMRDQVFAQYDARAFKFKNLLTQKQFGYQLSLVKKQ